MKWDGLDELRAALRALPEELTDDATNIVANAAARAYTAIYQEYGVQSGNLRAGLRQESVSETKWGTAVLLKNTSKHAWLWDNGTEARHYTTSKGRVHATGRMWGKSSPPHTFVKHASRSRLLMWDELIAMMESHGLTVRGTRFDAA